MPAAVVFAEERINAVDSHSAADRKSSFETLHEIVAVIGLAYWQC